MGGCVARIFHLEDDLRIRKKFAQVMEKSGHTVVGVSILPLVIDVLDFDLYVCGPLGKYSDGLGFAAEMKHKGKKVVILSDRLKFSRIPYIGVHTLTSNKEGVIQKINEILAEG
jgi:hypothetical protein